MKRPIYILLAALALLTGGCRNAPQWKVAEGAVWHTTYRIVYDAPEALDDSIQAVLRQVEMSLSPFARDSRISRINRGETDSVDADIAAVFAVAQQVNRLSHGRFDPTVAPLVDLWGFGTDMRSRALAESDTAAFAVTDGQIAQTLRAVGIDSCAIADGRIRRKSDGTTFNFSAVTKGYGCDRIAAMLARNGSKNHMVEIGGEIALGGHNPQGEPWRIQIDAPVESEAPVHQRLSTVALEGPAGIATSGNYRNFHTSARYGRFGHTIDPQTGRPVRTDVVSATVVAPTTAQADAWATACMASEADSAIARMKGVEGLRYLLVVAKDDSLTTVSTL